MTKKQALNYLKSSGFSKEQIKAVVDALQEPTTKNDLVVDCISRADVNRIICEYRDDVAETGNERDLERAYGANAVGELISELPSVTPQPRKGHWIANAPQYDMLNPQYICSECGNAHTRTTPYCEMCGAKMVEPKESEG